MITAQERIRRQELNSQGYWEIPEHIDDSGFDYSWRPRRFEPPQIYQFGTQWQRTGGPRFVVSESIGTVYMDTQRVISLPQPEKFRVLVNDEVIFDRSWHPDGTEPPFIYVWGNKWNDVHTEPTIEYHTPEATQRKYMNERVETRSENWHTLIEGADIDKSWRPNPYDPPYIYVWGNKWNDVYTEPTVEYHVPGATERKYMSDRVADLSATEENWHTLIEGADIDKSWRPNPYDPPYIYVWGNKWNEAEVEPTVEYHVPGATERKYMSDMVAVLPQQPKLWTTSNSLDLKTFDYSWRPNPYAPPQTYVWWENNGPVYNMMESIGTVYMNRDESNSLPIPQYYIETTLEDLINQHSDEVFWALNRELKYDNFDFTWKPSREIHEHLNAFGNEFSKDTGTYYVNAPAWLAGNRDINYVEEVTISVETDIDMCYVIRGNNTRQYEQLLERFPRLQKTRFLSNWIDTINRCIKKSTTKFMWILSSDLDYSDFEFDYYPSQWNQNYVNVFGTQWGRWGNTYLINTTTFTDDTKYISQIEHLTNINHVRTRRANIAQCLYDVVYIDFGNPTDNLQKIKSQCGDRTVTELQYDGSYYTTLKQWATGLSEYEIRSEHLVWVCTSVIDYDKFDFTWVSDPFQRDQLHVFSVADGDAIQNFGDTFLLNLTVFRQDCELFDRLEEYAKQVNYVKSANRTKRLPHPVIRHECDSQTDAIRLIEETMFPYTELVCEDSLSEQRVIPNLWDSEHHSVVVASTGASRIFVPTIAIDRIHDEVYDYPYIETVDRPDTSRLLDVIFFSNGEPGADENFEYLQSLGLSNRIIHQRGVSGRVASQHAAAETSETGWYFLINAKLRVNPTFDFTWQPDRLQRAKHYIFSATNPVNGLEYGHQAIVANNRRLTLATVADGLDFTMSSPHEVVGMNSGVAYYNTDPWTTWRTAFREAIKLQYYSKNGTVKENQDRLEAWLRIGNGENGCWSTGGAYDAVEYYHSVDGNLSELMRSYDWAWLREYYDERYDKK
jgi:hypothetical protein